MRGFIRQQRPAAFAISLLALFLAIGGGAFAAGGSDNKKDKKIANQVVNKRAPNLSVKHARTADSASNASSADKAKNVFGVSVNSAGTTTASTLPGTTSAKFGSNTYTVTFPRSVQGCVPVASTSAATGGQVHASLDGPANPNRVDLFTESPPGVPDFSLTVVC